MILSKRITALPVLAAALAMLTVSLSAKDPDYQMVELDNVSRYIEDRVGYQQIQKWTDPVKDDSIATLLLIRKGKMYLIKDGYDNPKDVDNTRRKLILDNYDFREEDLWANKINGKPDYVRVTDRREELTKNFDEEYVSKNFGAIYIKSRDLLISEHVTVFRRLMRDRRESMLTVVREPLMVSISNSANAKDDKGMKYYTSATAKSNEGWVYYAEDSDGDGITETFSVHIPDNFHWGYKSGPNVIFIYKNKDKDVEKLMKDITNEAYYGTPEEAKSIVDTFPKDDDISNIIKRK